MIGNEVQHMLYKRSEYFRYTFGEPLKAGFRIMIADKPGKESHLGECSIVDLSPGGAKLFTKFDIPLEGEPVHIHTEFTLYETPIDVRGILVWKKPYSGGHLYGLDFDENHANEVLIVNELKLRRRSEKEVGKK
jgi:hypothetical protein